MRKIRFNGPKGSRFVGLELRAMALGNSRLGVVEELQIETGLTMAQMLDRGKDEQGAFGAAVVAYLSIANARIPITWAEAREFTLEDLDVIDTTPPAPDEAEATAPDPTSAPTGSVRGDDAPAAARRPDSKKQAARRKQKSRSSASRSRPAS